LLLTMEPYLVLRTANTAPVWRGETHCFPAQSDRKNWIHTSAALYQLWHSAVAESMSGA